MADLEMRKLPEAGCEMITREQQIIEAVLLGLRKTEGIDITGFGQDERMAVSGGNIHDALDIGALDRRMIVFADCTVAELTEIVVSPEPERAVLFQDDGMAVAGIHRDGVIDTDGGYG